MQKVEVGTVVDFFTLPNVAGRQSKGNRLSMSSGSLTLDQEYLDGWQLLANSNNVDSAPSEKSICHLARQGWSNLYGPDPGGNATGAIPRKVQ